jgi:hypothetical protein
VSVSLEGTAPRSAITITIAHGIACRQPARPTPPIVRGHVDDILRARVLAAEVERVLCGREREHAPESRRGTERGRPRSRRWRGLVRAGVRERASCSLTIEAGARFARPSARRRPDAHFSQITGLRDPSQAS